MLNAKEYVKATACVAAVAILLLTVWFASDVVLLAFAGILLAIILRTVSDFLARVLRLPPGVALAVTCLLLVAAIALCGWFVAPRLSGELDQLRTQIPDAWHQLLARLQRNDWAGAITDRMQSEGLSYRRLGGNVLNAFSGVTSVAGSFVIVLFLALYFATSPEQYVGGFLKLLPKAAEQRGHEVLDICGGQLRKWLLAKLSMMVFVGVATAIGLWALQSPLILSLALLAALMDFIPNVGPIISAAPAVLIALSRGPQEVLWITALYFAVQIVESYILQPVIQKRAVDLPPSVTLLSQVLVGSLLGPLGLVLATPLTVVGLTLLRTVYIQDILRK